MQETYNMTFTPTHQLKVYKEIFLLKRIAMAIREPVFGKYTIAPNTLRILLYPEHIKR